MPAILIAALLLACGDKDNGEQTGPTDAGTADGGTADGGTAYGGTADGGTADGGTSDGGTTDGGIADGGTSDGGIADGGTADGGTADGGTSDGPCVPPDGATIPYDIYEPTEVVLPGAGGSFVDPTFGNTLIQVTDSATDGFSYHAYSYWPVFNADSTMLHIAKGDVPTLYDFDPDTHALSERGQLFPSDVDCNWETAAWSHTDPELLYCHSLTSKILYSFDVTAGDSSGLTIIHDFKDDLKGTDSRYLNQMLVDKADNVFTFHTRDARSNGVVAIAYERDTDTVYLRDYSTEILDETHIDHAGNHVVVLLSGKWEVWDFRADTVVVVDSVETERGGYCHQAAGSNLYVGGDCWETGFLTRTLDDPLDFTHLVSLYKSDGVTKSWDQDTHVSINQWDERYFIASLYSYPDGDWTPWEQEIIAVATDGSWVVRLAHHHSDVLGGGYYASPRVSISYDGRYAAFTSSWDGVGMDVFLLELPTLCE